MIAFCATAYDLDGQIVIHEEVDIINAGRRSQKQKTLDGANGETGGVAICDKGFVWGDIDFRVDTELTESERSTVLHLLQNYSSLRIAVNDGCFDGQISRVNSMNGRIIIYVSLFEKLSD